MRKLSCVAPEWWDYTTVDADIVSDAAQLTPQDIQQLSRPGFRVVMYDTIEEFYLAEALEYIEAWKQSTPDNPAGVCGPIGPTEQLPLVARLVNAMDLNLGRLEAHFWGMDEWVLDGQAVGEIGFAVIARGLQGFAVGRGLPAHGDHLQGHHIHAAGRSRGKVIGQAEALLISLARKGEPGNLGFRIRGVDDEGLAFGLAGPVAIDRLGVEPVPALGVGLHPAQAGLEFPTEFFPGLALGVFGPPGEPEKLITVQEIKNGIQRQGADFLRSP